MVNVADVALLDCLRGRLFRPTEAARECVRQHLPALAATDPACELPLALNVGVFRR